MGQPRRSRSSLGGGMVTKLPQLHLLKFDSVGRSAAGPQEPTGPGMRPAAEGARPPMRKSPISPILAEGGSRVSVEGQLGALVGTPSCSRPGVTVIEILKVSSKSNPNSVAGALAGVVRGQGSAEIQVVGAGALNQAIKAVAIARGYVVTSGWDLTCRPTFADVEIEGRERTAIRLLVEACDPRFAADWPRRQADRRAPGDITPAGFPRPPGL